MLVGRGISAAHGRESKDMSNRRNAVQMKEEINSNRKINNQILGAEKEVERVVVVVECSADCRNTTRQRVGRAPLPPLQLLLLLLWYKKLNGWPSNSLKEVSHDLL